ncbi:MAG: DNA-deoxyinosine glycosylase [Aquisalimonadaceae bacterium]
MSRVYGFPPHARADAQILILGSMPGKASLRERKYYAHPRNAFWPIICTILDAPMERSYEERVSSLLEHRIALWDVLKTCVRGSSLDSDIDEASIVPNDFEAFFARHPAIRRVCFNGAKAEAAFMRYVKPALPAVPAELAYFRLPSTSPANASFSFDQKLNAWRAVFR